MRALPSDNQVKNSSDLGNLGIRLWSAHALFVDGVVITWTVAHPLDGGDAAASHLAVSEIERRVLFPQQLLFRRFGQLHNGRCRYGIAGAICVSCVKLELPDRADALAN